MNYAYASPELNQLIKIVNEEELPDLIEDYPTRLLVVPDPYNPPTPNMNVYFPTERNQRGVVKQRGLECPRCKSILTSYKCKEKRPKHNGGDTMKTDIFICHVAEFIHNSKVNPCVNCPICRLDEQLMLRLRHVCFSNPEVEVEIKADGFCDLCGYKPKVTCNCCLCNVLPHSQKFHIIPNYDLATNSWPILPTSYPQNNLYNNNLRQEYEKQVTKLNIEKNSHHQFFSQPCAEVLQRLAISPDSDNFFVELEIDNPGILRKLGASDLLLQKLQEKLNQRRDNHVPFEVLQQFLNNNSTQIATITRVGDTRTNNRVGRFVHSLQQMAIGRITEPQHVQMLANASNTAPQSINQANQSHIPFVPSTQQSQSVQNNDMRVEIPTRNLIIDSEIEQQIIDKLQNFYTKYKRHVENSINWTEYRKTYQEMLGVFINSENTSNIYKTMSKIFLSIKQQDDTPVMLDKINNGLFLLDKPEFETIA